MRVAFWQNVVLDNGENENVRPTRVISITIDGGTNRRKNAFFIP